MIDNKHPAYLYAQRVVTKQENAPRYVIKQCRKFLDIVDGKNEKYCINQKTATFIDGLLSLMIMPKGLAAGKTIKSALSGFQWLLIVAVLCTVHRDNICKRRYTAVVLEICRKNGKTFIIAVLFILLFFIEPRFSAFFSVAPDGELSRQVKGAIKEIIQSSPALNSRYKGKKRFKILQNEITCNMTMNTYKPLNYSNSRLDGRSPNAFLADEVGALPNSYAIEAMQSGQVLIPNKLGFIISTKYPESQNPFEDEVGYAKKVLDEILEDEEIFALLYEPDNSLDWMTDDGILEQGNPLAIGNEEMWANLQKKRTRAIEMPSRRENFLCKNCNIIYQGVGTESYVDIKDLQKGRMDSIDWTGKKVYLGVDLAMTNDNCSVAMVSWNDGTVLAEAVAFVPEGRIGEKNRTEKIDYRLFIEAGKCIACGDRTVDYSVIENFVSDIESRYGVKVMGIGFDRYNALSSAQKWENEGYVVCEVKQHSSVLHPATKWLYELITDGKFFYEKNTLYEINFESAKCVFDTNMNRYVNKKKSGKVDMVVATINAMYMLQQNEILTQTMGWAIQI